MVLIGTRSAVPRCNVKIALVGTEVTSWGYTPWEDTSWKIWACSTPAPDYPRVNALFELHNLEWAVDRDGEEVLAWLEKVMKMPEVWVARKTQLIPHAKVFPRDELVSRFGPYFFTSTPAWMIAKAIHDGATEIGLFGISMSAASEYAFQRPGMQYFLQVCDQLGIRVTAPLESDILQPPPQYGYREFEPLFRKMDAARRSVEARLEANLEQQDILIRQAERYRGGLERINYDAQTFSMPEPTKKPRIVHRSGILPGNDFVGEFMERGQSSQPTSPPLTEVK